MALARGCDSICTPAHPVICGAVAVTRASRTQRYLHQKRLQYPNKPMKRESKIDRDDFWKSIKDQVKKGRRLNELRPELNRAGIIGSFFRHNPPLACPVMDNSSTCIVPTTATTTTTTTTHEDEKQQRLEEIQTHVKLCVMVWAATSSSKKQGDGSDHSAFVKAYAKCLRKNKKILKKRKKQKHQLLKETTEEQIVLDDLVRIFETAAFHLGPQAPMSQFLQDCIPRDCYQPKMRYLWDFLELQNPYKTPTKPAELPPLVVKRNKRKRAKPKATMEITPMQPKENQLFPDHVALTVPFRKHNSLTQRNRFVGSHFNSGLSNMDVLFRQVTVVKKQTKQPKQSKSPCNTINVVPPTPCVIRTPIQDKTAAIVAGAFRSIKRLRRN